jgi:hypothetical protein
LADQQPKGILSLRLLPLALALLAILIVSLGAPRALAAPAQSQITLSYKVVGGGSYQPPTVWYLFNGKNVSSALSGTPTTFTADNGTRWVVSKSLGGGESYLRWEINGNNSGMVSGQTQVLTYYTQYYATFGLPPAVLNTSLYAPTVNFTSFGVRNTVTAGQSAWADYLTTYNYSSVPTVLPGSRWYYPTPGGVIEGAFSTDPYHVEQYLLDFSLQSTGGEPLHSANFSEIYGGEVVNYTLTASGGPFWADANSTLAFQPTIYSQSGTNRWVLHSVEPANASAPSDVSAVYFEQYPFSVSFSVGSGLAPSGPVINGTSNGQSTSVQLYPGAPLVWLDAQSGYTLSPSLAGSTPTERWLTTANTSGVAGGPTSLSIEYFHQVFVEFSYSIVGGGGIPPSDVSFYSYGAKNLVPLTTSIQGVWADFGTDLVFRGNFSAGSQTERWMLASAPTVAAAMPAVLSLVYYHQYLVPAVFTIVGGGNPPAPLLSGSSLGNPFEHPISPGGAVWLDGGSNWSVPGILSGGSGERWVAAGQTNGTVGAAIFPALSYGHEYFVTTVSDPPGAAALTPSGWVQAGQSLSVSEQTGPAWYFAGWVGSGQGSHSGQEGSFSISVSAPIQETANFYAGLAVQVTGAGSVLVTYGSHTYTVTGELTLYVKPGSNITLVARPGPLQVFKGWQGIPAGGASAVLFPVSKPMGVGVNFAVNLDAALALVVLICGAAIYAVAYLAWSERVSPGRLTGLLRRKQQAAGYE